MNDLMKLFKICSELTLSSEIQVHENRTYCRSAWDDLAMVANPLTRRIRVLGHPASSGGGFPGEHGKSDANSAKKC